MEGKRGGDVKRAKLIIGLKKAATFEAAMKKFEEVRLSNLEKKESEKKE